MMSIAMYIPGEDIESRTLRKTLCQNCNLMIVLLFRTISDSVRSRLETLQQIVDAGNFYFILSPQYARLFKFTRESGLMTRQQKELYESAEVEHPGVNLYWLPGLWFCHDLREAQKNGQISFNDGARLITAVII
jgi:bestrophin-3